MPFARQLTVLNLYDVLTNLVPGATVLLAAFLVFPVESSQIGGSTSVLAFVALLGSLLVGYLLQWVRGEFGKQPNEFQMRMDAVRDGNPKDFIHDDFLDQTNGYFDIDDDFDDGTRFRLILSYLETKPPVRAIRFQSVYSFYRSLFPASIVAAGLAVVAGIIHLVGLSVLPVRAPTYVGFTFCAAALLTYVSRERRNKFEKTFVGYAIREFYLEQLADEEEDPPS